MMMTTSTAMSADDCLPFREGRFRFFDPVRAITNDTRGSASSSTRKAETGVLFHDYSSI
jgi:hypothetical protein